MKKIYSILFTLTLLPLMASAQEAVITQEGRVPYIIPGEVTADGKPRVCVRMTRKEGGDIFYIYNKNMELETSFEAPQGQYTTTSTTESATVPGTSMYSYDDSNAEWHLDEQSQGVTTGKLNDYESFFSLDANTYMRDYDEVMPTQTLFNNDENWELVVCPSGTYSYISPESYDANSGTVLLKRYTMAVNEALSIFNQNGQRIGTIGDGGVSDIEAVWIINGKKYVSTLNTDKSSNYINKFYLVNDSGTSNVPMRGDVNKDGEVNIPDAMYIVNKILNGKFPDEKTK